MKSWLAQDNLGGQVTLLPGTSFLYIKGALAKPSSAKRLTLYIVQNWYSTLQTDEIGKGIRALLDFQVAYNFGI